MKKGLLFIAIISAFSFASCKKDRICVCTTTVNGASNSGETTIKDTKKKAEDACNKGDQAETTTNGITSKVDCELK